MTYAIMTVVVLILDQLMKFWTTKNIPVDAVGADCVELIPKVLHLTNVHNTGAAFSMSRRVDSEIAKARSSGVIARTSSRHQSPDGGT